MPDSLPPVISPLSPTYGSFAQTFGVDQADAVLLAALSHGNSINDENKGSDVFRWAILICIGYECMSNEGSRKSHGITAPWPAIQQWIKDHADLGHHQGDCDYLALLLGCYNEYITEPNEASGDGSS